MKQTKEVLENALTLALSAVQRSQAYIDRCNSDIDQVQQEHDQALERVNDIISSMELLGFDVSKYKATAKSGKSKKHLAIVSDPVLLVESK